MSKEQNSVRRKNTTTTNNNTTTKKRMYNCGKCAKGVTNGQQALECAKCKIWFHISCENISRNLYLALREQEEADTLPFYCRNCKKQIDTYTDKINELEDAYTNRINELEERIKGLEERREVGKQPQHMERMTGVLQQVMDRLEQMEERMTRQDDKIK